MTLCTHCASLNLPCVFPEDSEQCCRCRDFQRRCEGSTSDEDYEQIKDELQDVQDQMDVMLIHAGPNPETFQRMKEQCRLLEEKRSLRFDQHDEAQRKQQDWILAAERELRRRLEMTRQQALPENSQYQALLERRAALEEREAEVFQRWHSWLNETCELTDYPNYRGLPMAEDLDEDQWKAAIAWAQKHPGSHADYPSPSSICDVTDEEVGEPGSDQVRAEFRKILQKFYPLFDTLTEHKTVAKESQSATGRNGVGLLDDDIGRIRSDLDGMKTGVGLLQALVDRMKETISIAREHTIEDDPSASSAPSIHEQFHHICRDFFTLFSMIDSSKLSSSALREDDRILLQQMQTGIKEVERFLSKLRLTTLLFPNEALNPKETVKEGPEVVLEYMDERDMDLS